MWFGVRDALALAQERVEVANVTILGELIDNELVRDRLLKAGVSEGDLFGEDAPTAEVVVTAHGASEFQKNR